MDHDKTNSMTKRLDKLDMDLRELKMELNAGEYQDAIKMCREMMFQLQDIRVYANSQLNRFPLRDVKMYDEMRNHIGDHISSISDLDVDMVYPVVDENMIIVDVLPLYRFTPGLVVDSSNIYARKPTGEELLYYAKYNRWPDTILSTEKWK